MAAKTAAVTTNEAAKTEVRAAGKTAGGRNDQPGHQG